MRIGPAGQAERLDWIDAARGGAIIGMIVYHAAWDMGYFSLVGFDATVDLPWTILARIVAGTFLALVGFNLVLATRRGIRWRRYLRRLAVLVAAALAVTVVTRITLPDIFVFFGILHAIAAFSVLGLAFLRLPAWLIAVAAAACLAAPLLLSGPAFDGPLLWWLGLSPHPPATVDFVPVFPWFGVTLAGMVGGRLWLALGERAPGAGWQAASGPARALVRAGRWSLVIYLLHQPLLIGLFYLVVAVAGPSEAAQIARLRDDCVVRQCLPIGHAEAACGAYCGCLIEGYSEAGLLAPVIDGRLSEAEQTRRFAIIDRCRPALATPRPSP